MVILHFIGADKGALYLTLIAFGTPLGLNTVVFPAAYGGDTSTGASMAMISHTLCVITIPLMYALLTAFVSSTFIDYMDSKIHTKIMIFLGLYR